MDANWIDYIPWIYASVQVLITLIISIMGVKYVRNEFLIQKCKVDEQLQIAIGDGKGDDHDYIAINKQIKDTESKHDETGTQPHKSVQFKVTSCVTMLSASFCLYSV